MEHKGYSPIYDYFDISYTSLLRTIETNTDYKNYLGQDISGNKINLFWGKIIENSSIFFKIISLP